MSCAECTIWALVPYRPSRRPEYFFEHFCGNLRRKRAPQALRPARWAPARGRPALAPPWRPSERVVASGTTTCTPHACLHTNRMLSSMEGNYQYAMVHCSTLVWARRAARRARPSVNALTKSVASPFAGKREAAANSAHIHRRKLLIAVFIQIRSLRNRAKSIARNRACEIARNFRVRNRACEIARNFRVAQTDTSLNFAQTGHSTGSRRIRTLY
jgi:hypothetical protein